MLVENVIFILLNILFLSILIVFLVKQGSGAIVLEQSYAKEMALTIDSARPDMIIKMDLSKGMKLSDKNGINFADVVKRDGNVIRVKLNDKGGYTYSYFNDVSVDIRPDTDVKTNEYNGMYVIVVSSKNVG